MKQRFFALSKFFIGVLAFGVITFSCNRDKDDKNKNNTTKISASATGAQEVPAVTTPATGTLTGNYDKNTKMLTYNVTWQNLKDSATAAHFHGPASQGQNAGVLIPIFTDKRAMSGSASGTVTLADTTAQHFMNGKIYLNIHSKTHPGGEIRGQVTMQ